jgi:hypothetical protein
MIIYIHISSNFINTFLGALAGAGANWKIIIISKLVGISEAIRLILIIIKLIGRKIYLIYKSFISLGARYILVGLYLLYKSIINFTILSQNIDDLSNNNQNNISNINISNNNCLNNKDPLLKFNEWLAGLIDGDGYFLGLRPKDMLV